MLRLVTFGGVSLRPADPGGAAETRPVSRRGLAVLTLLAARPEGGVSRDAVVACLWPESDEERARNALRQTLFALRRDLGLPDLFIGGPDLLLDPGVVTSDAREFEMAWRAGDLEALARLYTGPFLEGFHLAGVPEFERWVDGRRADYAARAASSLEALARKAGALGDHAAAVEGWRRLLTMDPLNTRVVMESMRAQASAGNTAAALREAQAHDELLRAEVGASPDPAFRELVAALRRGALVAAAPVPAPATRAAAPAAPAGARERLKDRLAVELADRFDLEDPVGSAREGGIRLLAARDRRHDRRVILKVIHAAIASQIDVERFVREIRLTGRLLHPHILPLLDSGEAAGCPWFAVPALEGETLRALLTREGPLPLQDALRLTQELAEALGFVHAHGVVHRDVSPENVLVAGDHALLTNLGVARALDTAAGGGLTVSGMLLGSAAYMSPEQAKGAREVDARTDVYSLGAVLFEMLTGEALFSGPTSQAIMAKRAGEPTPGPERLRDIPAGVAAILRKALAGSAAGRYASMEQFAAALRSSMSDTGGGRGSWRDLVAWLLRRRART